MKSLYYYYPVRLPAVALGAGDLEVYDPEELGVGGGATLRCGDGGERGGGCRAVVGRTDADTATGTAAQGGEKAAGGRRCGSAA